LPRQGSAREGREASSFGEPWRPRIYECGVAAASTLPSDILSGAPQSLQNGRQGVARPRQRASSPSVQRAAAAGGEHSVSR